MIIFLFITGIFIGSFLNVLIDRIPKGEDFMLGRSHCDFCKKILEPLDLIPLFSFLFLKGRCRYCHKKLSWQYPVIEFISGLILSFFFLTSVNYQMMLFNYFLFAGLLVIFVSDLKYRIIPDQIVGFLVILQLAELLIISGNMTNHIFSGIGFFLFFLLLVIITKGKGMGLGDVKYSFFMGLLLGFPKIIVAFYASFLTGAVFSLILILKGKKTMKSTVAFGPFLVFGTVVTYHYGNRLWVYFRMITGI